MSKISEALTYGLTIRESATDGSDFTNPAADYRRLFLGEDGNLHLRDSAGTITDIGGSGGTLPTAHGCRVKRASGNFSVGNNTLTAVQFDAEDYDTDTMHDNSTNTTRIVIPTISGVTTGLWAIKACGYTDLGAAGRVDVVFRKNAAGNPASGTSLGFSSDQYGATLTSYMLAVDAVLSATDYVECFVRTTSGTYNVSYDADVSPIFSVAFLGKVT
jgi:hypothetical protein